MKIFLITLFSCWSLVASAQEAIHGTIVKDSTEAPLAGATVKVKGSTALAVSGDNGEFIIAVPAGAFTLQLSFTGYKSRELTLMPPLKAPLRISLFPNQNELKELIVSTGYQDFAKERATGSFSKIDNATFNQQVSTDVLSRLEAVANGLLVDRKTNSAGILIRGLSTIQGIPGPLIILDNFPYEGDVNNINPNDVESITLLKDAAAASIWGTRAGNGVIVITTKKGKYNQPLTVEFNANLSTSQKPDLSYFRQMTSADYIGVEQMLFGQGYYDALISDPAHPGLSHVVELLSAERNGTISPADAGNQINSLKNQDVRNDLEKYVYRPLFNQQYALNLRGGSPQYSWSASGGYDKNIGNLNEKYDRLNLHYQNKIRIKKNLELSSDIYYTKSNALSGRLPYGDPSYGVYPYSKLADQNGNPLPVASDYSLSYLSTLDNRLEDWKNYPLANAGQDVTTTATYDVVINAGLEYKIINGLNVDLKYQYEHQQTAMLDNHSPDSYYTRNLFNSFTQIDSSGNVTNNIPQGGINDYTNTDLVSQDIRGQLSFNRSWGKNSISAIGGAELRNAVTNAYTFRAYGVNPENLSTGTVDYNTPFPNYISGNYDFIPYIDGLTGLTNRYVSLFSNAAYTYNDRYTVSLSGRRDASNLFGVNTNNKWTPLWSAGAGWTLSNEPFYKSEILPFLRLRATYGFSGNVDQTMSGVTVITTLGNSLYSNSPFARILKYANPDLRWERIGMLNLAVDFRSANNRLTGSVEYYQKRGIDLFGPTLVDYTTGIGSNAVKNVASMKGNGMDIEINSINTTGLLKWTTNLNLSLYHDKITAYYQQSLIGSNFVGGTSQNISGLVGKPVYSILSYKWAGLDPATGDPRGYLNGQVSKDYASILGDGTAASDLVYSGPALPTVFGSLGNTVAWHQLSLTARLLYKFGYYFRRPAMDYNALFSYGQGNVDFSKRWRKPGDEKFTNVPSMVYPDDPNRDQFYTGSGVNVDKGDNIRFQYLNLAYDLATNQLRHLPFSRFDIYLNVSNLGIIWRANKDKIDPDYPIGTLPPPRIYAIGFKGTF